jgi:hypothetical protein
LAITWKNINAPSFGAANLLSQSAGNRISEGIEGLRDLAQGQANNIRTEEAELTENNTQDVLNQVYGLQSMEDYNSAVSEGTFDLEALDNTYGGKVDVGQIRNALLAQDNTIQDQENTRLTYENNVRQRKDTPIANQFTQDLYNAKTLGQVDSLITNLEDIGLSEAGQTAAIKTANDYKQSLLDQSYQATQRQQNQLLFDQSQDDRTYNLEQRFIKDYNPEKTRTVVGLDGKERTETYYPKLDTQNTISSATSKLAELPTKYAIPDNFDDVIQSGTASDAVSSFIQSQDRNDIAVQDVHNDITTALKENTFTDSQGKGYTYSSLPKWVVEQALQEVTLTDSDWKFTDWGKGDISGSQVDSLVKSVNKNLELYGTLTEKKQLMDAEKALLSAQINDAQVKQLKLIQEAREDFSKSTSKNRNM